MTERSILTIRQFSEKHTAFSEAGLRHLIFQGSANNFNKVIRRAGKKILIDEQLFFNWLDSKLDENQKGGM